MRGDPAAGNSARCCGAGVLAPIRRLIGSRKGAGAVEFALVAPVLILLYIGSAEVSVALSVNKKVARAASTVADLVTQRQSVDKAFLASMTDVVDSVMAPYGESPIKLRITGIKIDGKGKAKVDWSWDQDGKTPYARNVTAEIPDDLKIDDSYLVRAELDYDHKLLLMLPGAEGFKVNALTLSKTYYFRPRIGDSVACSDC
jgi:Flp pilus assembly protein TadG